MSHIVGLRCLNCAAEYPEQQMFDGCPRCRTEAFSANVIPVYDYGQIKKKISRRLFDDRKPGLWAYRELLPVKEESIVTLREGGTPLIPCPELGKKWGLKNFSLKTKVEIPPTPLKTVCAPSVYRKRAKSAAK